MKDIAVMFFTLIVLIALETVPLAAQPHLTSTGLNLGLGFWNMGNEAGSFSYRRKGEREYFKTPGGGFRVSFTSRTSEKWTFELELSAFWQAEGESFTSDAGEESEKVDRKVVIPLLFGAQWDLLDLNSRSKIRPYLTGGGGPYWIADIKSVDEFDEPVDEIEGALKLGAYLGGGVTFLPLRNFGLNFNVRYHFVNFDIQNDVSGIEFGVGLNIMWGNFSSVN